MRSHLKKKSLITLAITVAATFGVPLMAGATATADTNNVVFCNNGFYNTYYDVRPIENNGTLGQIISSGDLIGSGGNMFGQTSCATIGLDHVTVPNVQVYLSPRNGANHGHTFTALANTSSYFECHGYTWNADCS